MGQSINQIPKCCVFFSAKRKKKIQGCIFFFPRKSSWGIHSGSGGFFFIFFESGVCFFFPHVCVFFLCFFFPVKVHMPFIHSISKLYFFFVAGKKNTAFSFIQSILPQNVKKMNFYRKKKYDTFARVLKFYPPGSKSVALQLGVHLILLYFIRIWSWVRRLFFYFDGGWWMGGRWITTFWFFKSLDITKVYSLGVYVYI